MALQRKGVRNLVCPKERPQETAALPVSPEGEEEEELAARGCEGGRRDPADGRERQERLFCTSLGLRLVSGTPQ